MDTAHVSTIAPSVSSTATIPIKIRVVLSSRHRCWVNLRNSQMLSVIPIEYETYSKKNVNVIRISTKLAVDADIFWEVALETPLEVTMSNIALNA